MHAFNFCTLYNTYGKIKTTPNEPRQVYA
jgi:hypothetical protein